MKLRHAHITALTILCLTGVVGSAKAAGLEPLAISSMTTARNAEGSAIIPYPQAGDKAVNLWKSHAKQLVTITWSKKEWKAFQRIIWLESRWTPNQLNKATGAYGLGQIVGSKRYTAGMPCKQINAAIKYIWNRYHTPTKALRHHNKWGWY
jgi:hypothetical protein